MGSGLRLLNMMAIFADEMLMGLLLQSVRFLLAEIGDGYTSMSALVSDTLWLFALCLSSPSQCVAFYRDGSIYPHKKWNMKLTRARAPSHPCYPIGGIHRM